DFLNRLVEGNHHEALRAITPQILPAIPSSLLLTHLKIWFDDEISRESAGIVAFAMSTAKTENHQLTQQFLSLLDTGGDTSILWWLLEHSRTAQSTLPFDLVASILTGAPFTSTESSFASISMADLFREVLTLSGEQRMDLSAREWFMHIDLRVADLYSRRHLFHEALKLSEARVGRFSKEMDLLLSRSVERAHSDNPDLESLFQLSTKCKHLRGEYRNQNLSTVLQCIARKATDALQNSSTNTDVETVERVLLLLSQFPSAGLQPKEQVMKNMVELFESEKVLGAQNQKLAELIRMHDSTGTYSNRLKQS
ncbi:MAG: hypothetical protein K2Z81_18885, partial [Cyanobacteria bacterium]|nr:hypothetical protein [Cyanobacteriota bacterium]